MLLNNFRPDEDDRFYFLFRFAVRSWLLFLCLIFSYPIAGLWGRTLTAEQFLTYCCVFVLILAVDFIGVWVKAYPIYKEQEQIEWENWGIRKTR